MSKPKTEQDYYDLADERGFEWLGPVVNNIQTKTWWRCSRGHRWMARYGSLKYGRRSGCPHCYGNTPLTAEDFRALAEARGWRWLGPEVNNSTKTGWECEQGHQWRAPYNNLSSGSGCPRCAGKAPRTPDDYHALAQERGFRWLGPEVGRVDKSTEWECKRGHKWQACFRNIQQGGGCPHCYGNTPLTAADFHALGQSRGWKWMGPESAR